MDHHRHHQTRALAALGAGLAMILGAAAQAADQDFSAYPIVEHGAKLQKLGGGFVFTEGPASDKDGNIYFTAQPKNRIWKWTTLAIVPFPVSLWNGVRVPQVVQTPLPFQPVFASSMRPSMPFAKKPSG